MSVHASIVEGPLSPAPALRETEGAGARLVFEGLVRRIEGGRDVESLEYEAYEPMASRMLERLAGDIVARHRLLGLRVEHSRGVVPVGRASLRVVIDGAHRAEALAAMGEFIDLLKRDVPIWKKPVWAR